MMRSEVKEPKIKSIEDAMATIEARVIATVGAHEKPQFIPSGLGDLMIQAVGSGDYEIVNFQAANKSGKTTHAVAILANIFWEPDEEYFNGPIFTNYPFRNTNGEIIKRARIIGTVQNTADTGPIRLEILRWFPKGRYTSIKAGKNYYSSYKTDTGWELDVMTYSQEAAEFEGPLISLIWTDEPVPTQLIGAITSRFSYGGLWLSTQSPINAGEFVGALRLMADAGTKIKNIYGSIYDNCSETGIPNSKGTRKGLLTPQQIIDYKRKIPPSEWAARMEGKCLAQEGKVYPQWDDSIHVKEIVIRPEITRHWNCYCVMDPHDKAYPAIQWWAVLPPDPYTGKSIKICYNEYPTYNTLQGLYWTKRKSLECRLTPEQLSKIIKVLDGREMGMNVIKRGIDPRFAKNTMVSYRKGGGNIILDYAEHGLKFDLPQLGQVSYYRNQVAEGLYHDVDVEPTVYVMPHCLNTIEAFKNHFWIEGEDKESEQYKDFVDCTRMFFACLHENGGYKHVTASSLERQKRVVQKAIESPFNSNMSLV